MLNRRDFVAALAGASALGFGGCVSLPRRRLTPFEVASLGAIREIHVWTDDDTDCAEDMLVGVFQAHSFGFLSEWECMLISGADAERGCPNSSVVRLVYREGNLKTTLFWYDGGAHGKGSKEGVRLVGESGEILFAGYTLDGAVPAKTVRARLHEATAALRSAQRRPGFVFNASKDR